MNRSDLIRVARNTQHSVDELRKHGDALWNATRDWQGTLRSAGGDGRSSKGSHSDPTYDTAFAILQGKGLPHAHDDLVAAIAALDKAALTLAAVIRQLKPLDKNDPSIHRGRQNTVPACIVCAGPAVPARRGMCGTDYQAWLRADRPDLEGFKRQRQREAEAARQPLHEHEVA